MQHKTRTEAHQEGAKHHGKAMARRGVRSALGVAEGPAEPLKPVWPSDQQQWQEWNGTARIPRPAAGDCLNYLKSARERGFLPVVLHLDEEPRMMGEQPPLSAGPRSPVEESP